MKRLKKTALDLLDDIYSLAYWMTGNEEVSSDLVYSTYLSANTKTEEKMLLKTFRECYIKQFGQNAGFCWSQQTCKSFVQPEDSMMQSAADIKLSILLTEISGLKHLQISEIVGKPVETIRVWLLWGRELIAHTNSVNASRLKAS